MPEWLDESIKEAFIIKHIFISAEINNSLQIKTEMCLNGNHASPWVLPRNHFHLRQVSVEWIPSTAICVALDLRMSMGLFWRWAPSANPWNGKPPGAVREQDSLRRNLKKTTNTSKRWVWEARTVRKASITSPDEQSPSFVLICFPLRASNASGTSFICRWESLIWINSTATFGLCFVLCPSCEHCRLFCCLVLWVGRYCEQVSN